MPFLTAILPAAGSSTRFGSNRNKLLEDLGGRPVVVHAIGALLGHPQVDRVYIATQHEAGLRKLVEQHLGEAAARITWCWGGPSRQHSVLSALRLVDEQAEWVAIHDAARPLVSADLIDRTFEAARRYGAAAPAQAVALTIKQARAPLPAKVERTIPRHNLFAMQTPQVMRRRDLLAAFERCPIPLEQVTDDAQLLELAGQDVWLVDGEAQNLKITTALDLEFAQRLMRMD